LTRRDNRSIQNPTVYKVFYHLGNSHSISGGDANYERLENLASWYLRSAGGLFLNLGLSHGVIDSFGKSSKKLIFR
jgi:hypothetical protein